MFGLVISAKARQGKNGPYWVMDLKTPSGVIQGIIWDVLNPDNENVPRKGDLIKVTVFKDQLNTNYKNIIFALNAFHKVEKAELNEEDRQAIFDIPVIDKAELQFHLDNIFDKDKYHNIEIFNFVVHCIGSVGKEKWLKCPAAKGIHHNFESGLAVHTSEVLTIAKSIADNFPFKNIINSDVVIAGATLHDIGKTNTYYIDEVGFPKYRADEFLCGHSSFSIQIVKSAAANFNIEPQILSEILHIMASHHGRRDFAAVTEPMTLEAIIVSQADYLSSKGAALQTKLNELKKQQNKDDLGDNFVLHGNKHFITDAFKNYVK